MEKEKTLDFKICQYVKFINKSLTNLLVLINMSNKPYKVQVCRIFFSDNKCFFDVLTQCQ